MYRYTVEITATSEQGSDIEMTLKAIWANNPKQAIDKCKNFLEHQSSTNRPKTYLTASAARYREEVQ